MPLSPPTAREAIHHRAIHCRGYRRQDGLWDIEGHLTDIKSYPFSNTFRGEIKPGEPLHDMSLRLTIDEDMTVISVEAVTDAGPYAVCPAITSAFTKLEGLTIGPGWRREVSRLLGGMNGCTHLVELLGPLATTAFQTIQNWKPKTKKATTATSTDDRPPRFLNSCHALARNGDVVKQHYPQWYIGDDEADGKA